MPLKSTELMLRRCMIKLVRHKKLENITVAEICEKAQIGKRTFYRYYKDKYALFEDTYIQEFYNKLEITEDLYHYDMYERIIEQMSKDKAFFRHAIASKEQNGFWELISDLIYPLACNLLTRDPYIDKAKEYYIRRDIEIALHHIEEWIQGGFKQTPAEVVEFMRLCNALHGKWQYQICMQHTPDEFSMDKFINNEW